MTDESSETARAAWRGGELHDMVAAYRRGDLTPQQVMAREQQTFAEVGGAAGQCSSCGVYRLDGRPPVLHQPGCLQKPDLLRIYDL